MDNESGATVTRQLVVGTDVLNMVGLLRRPFLRQTAFINMKYTVLALLQQTICQVCDHQKWF